MPSYNPANHYWIVAGSATQVYSSAAVGYIPVTDPTYQTWLAQGRVPTPIAVEQDMFDVLALAGVTLPVGASPSDGVKGTLISNVSKVAFQVLFNHENRIRTLEAKPTITAAQFIAGVKALL